MVRCALYTTLVMALLLGAGTAGADLWTLPVFDDFEDGDHTNNPTWLVGGVPGATQNVMTWSGSNMLHLGSPPGTVDYPLTWSGASGAWGQGDQGIYTELDMTGMADDWGAGVVVRYEPPDDNHVGTGYAAIVHYVASQPAPGMWFSLVELAGPVMYEITTPVFITSAMQPMWVQIWSEEIGANTVVLAGAGLLGHAIPTTWWTLDSRVPGMGAGITNYYNGGYVGLIAAGDNSAEGGNAYYDNVRLVTPEPATMALMLLGMGGMAAWRRRRSKAAAAESTPSN